MASEYYSIKYFSKKRRMVSCIPRILSDILNLRNELLDLSDIEINSLVFAGGYLTLLR